MALEPRLTERNRLARDRIRLKYSLSICFVEVGLHRDGLDLFQGHASLAGNSGTVVVLGSGIHYFSVQLRDFDFDLSVLRVDLNELPLKRRSICW